MEEVITVADDSENSIIEVDVPEKLPPPLINIEDEEEIIINIERENRENVLAKDVIEKDSMLNNGSSSVQSNASVNSPSHWTIDMIKFYDDDWGGEEDFVVEKLQAKMNKSPSLWQISRKDYLNMKNKNSQHGARCSNCLHYGHHFTLCPEPPYVPKCSMCGNKGHTNNFCPYSKCLNCGCPSRKYIISCFKCSNEMDVKCSRCNLIGHRHVDCTDHWRLFHLTTNSVSVVVPENNVHKLKKDLWCCNCGNKGHYQTMCWQMKNPQFRDTFPFVVSYKKSFHFNQYKKKYNGFERKFIPKRQEDKMEMIKMNELNRAMKFNKLKIPEFHFKKLQRFKKRDKRRHYY